MDELLSFARFNMEPYTVKWVPERQPYEGHYEVSIADLEFKVSTSGEVVESIKIYDEEDNLEVELKTLKDIQEYIWN